jgi:hypothetical protein
MKDAVSSLPMPENGEVYTLLEIGHFIKNWQEKSHFWKPGKASSWYVVWKGSLLWQKSHSHAYTCAMVCSFVSFTHYLIYLRRQIAKKICLWRCLFASFVSFSQLIIVIWIKTSVGITTVFHTGISRAVAAA